MAFFLVPILTAIFGVTLLAILSKYALYVALVSSFFIFLIGVKLSRDIAGFNSFVSFLLGLFLAGILFLFIWQNVVSALVVGGGAILLMVLINFLVPTGIRVVR